MYNCISCEKPVDRDELERTRNTLAILNGEHDEADWLPQGFAKRPDLALELKPGVVASLAKPFKPSSDVGQSLSVSGNMFSSLRYSRDGDTGLCNSGTPLARASRRRSGAVSPVISSAGRPALNSARSAAMASAPVRCSRKR